MYKKFAKFNFTSFLVKQKNAIVLSGQTVTLNDRIMELYLNRDQYQLGLEFEARSAPVFNIAGFFINAMSMISRAEINDEIIRNKEMPQFILNGGVLKSKGKMDFNIFYKYMSSYESTRFVAVVKDEQLIPQCLGNFFVLNSTFGWSHGKNNQIRIYLEAINITDRKYSTVVGYPDFGRRFTIGIRQTLK